MLVFGSAGTLGAAVTEAPEAVAQTSGQVGQAGGGAATTCGGGHTGAAATAADVLAAGTAPPPLGANANVVATPTITPTTPATA